VRLPAIGPGPVAPRPRPPGRARFRKPA